MQLKLLRVLQKQIFERLGSDRFGTLTEEHDIDFSESTLRICKSSRRQRLGPAKTAESNQTVLSPNSVRNFCVMFQKHVQGYCDLV